MIWEVSYKNEVIGKVAAQNALQANQKGRLLVVHFIPSADFKKNPVVVEAIKSIGA